MLYMTIYAAHIVTSEANGYGDPEITVMTQADESGAAEEIASYPLAPGDIADVVLHKNGYRITSDATEVDFGYSIYNVEVADWTKVINSVKFNVAQAETERTRQETAWRTIIADAMNDQDTVKTKIAETAGISRERAYQIRDGRR